MDEKALKEKHFQKKVYTKLSKSDLSSLNPKESINHFSDVHHQKKIVATTIAHNIREEFKKTFVPLLIEVFELRQSITVQKSKLENPLFKDQSQKSLKEIVNRLKHLQKEIEETKRWCDGVALQIQKGLQEATNTSEEGSIEEPHDKTSFRTQPFLKKFLKLLKKTKS